MPTEAFAFRGDSDLVLLRDKLHDGSWEKMEAAPEKRLAGPVDHRRRVFITEDLEAVRRLKKSEKSCTSHA